MDIYVARVESAICGADRGGQAAVCGGDAEFLADTAQQVGDYGDEGKRHLQKRVQEEVEDEWIHGIRGGRPKGVRWHKHKLC